MNNIKSLKLESLSENKFNNIMGVEGAQFRRGRGGIRPDVGGPVGGGPDTSLCTGGGCQLAGYLQDGVSSAVCVYLSWTSDDENGLNGPTYSAGACFDWYSVF